MKKWQNVSILLFFILCFLIRGSIDHFLISYIKTPEVDETLKVENETLKEQIKDLEKELEMKSLFEKKIYSKVLYRSPYEFTNSLTILKGTEEEVKENMAVISGPNLIGIIEAVETHRSKVKLLTNEESAISVKINDTYGVMKTNKKGECWIENLSKNAKIAKEESVLTSGLTKIPANIPVGKVEEVQLDSLGFTQKVKVSLHANMEKINYVTLLGKEDTNE